VKRAKYAIIAVVLLAASAWIAHLHVVSQSYHPVVRLESPEGLTYTAVQDPQQERQACGAANDRFLSPIKKSCAQCRVVLARCERQLEGLELEVHEGRALPHYLVSGPGVRMAIEGQVAAARASCQQIAAEMVRSGLRNAACVPPATGTDGKKG